MDAEQVTKFTMYWTRAQPAVFAFITSTVTNFTDAEDVLQKVAAAAVHKFPEYDSTRPFTAWAFGIARFEILRYLRDHATDRHEFVTNSIDHVAAAFEAIHPELEDRRKALAECMQRVSGRSRTVLEHRYAEGKKTGVIAEIMGLTTGNVSVILNRTYKKLRECIDRRLAAEGAGL